MRCDGKLVSEQNAGHEIAASILADLVEAYGEVIVGVSPDRVPLVHGLKAAPNESELLANFREAFRPGLERNFPELAWSAGVYCKPLGPSNNDRKVYFLSINRGSTSPWKRFGARPKYRFGEGAE